MKNFQVIGAGVIGGVLGALVLWICQGHSLKLLPEEMTYADLSAVMLSAVSVLVTILGVIVAILAIWGYSHFKGIAEASAKAHVNSEMETGALKGHLEGMVTKFLQREFGDNGKMRALLEARVDQIIISGPSQRAQESAAQEEEEEDENVDL